MANAVSGFSPGLVVPGVAAALNDAGPDPGLLCLEVTESLLMQNVQRAVSVLEELKGLGVQIAIDDFGSENLRHLPFSATSWLPRTAAAPSA